MKDIGPKVSTGVPERDPTGVSLVSTDPTVSTRDLLLASMPQNHGVEAPDLLRNFYNAWFELPDDERPQEIAASELCVLLNSGGLILKGTVIRLPHLEQPAP